MASINSVQNFSLPKRASNIRTATPLGFRSFSDNTGRRDHDRNDDRVCSPSPTELRQFCFASSSRDSRSQNRPRPISMSSSAPVLTAIAADPHAEAKDKEDRRAREGDGRDNSHDNSLPISPCTSVWPAIHPMKIEAGGEKVRKAREAREARLKPNKNQTGNKKPDSIRDIPLHPDRPASVGTSPPPMARSISVRWGPQLRHISLTEAHTADEIYHRISILRRRRIIFWLLAGTLAAGLLSSTAAGTLLGASAAASATTTTPTAETALSATSTTWEDSMIAWLVASLAVSILAGSALASVLWQWKRGASQEVRILVDDVEQNDAHDSRNSHHRDCRMTPADQGWIELTEVSETNEVSGNARTKQEWWKRKKRASKCAKTQQKDQTGQMDQTAEENKGKGNAGNIVREGKDHDAKDEQQPADETEASGTAREVDRNWARFAENPMQLRRYVETLEAHLTSIRRVQNEEHSSMPSSTTSEDDKDDQNMDGERQTPTNDTSVVYYAYTDVATPSTASRALSSAPTTPTTAAETSALPGLAVTTDDGHVNDRMPSSLPSLRSCPSATTVTSSADHLRHHVSSRSLLLRSPALSPSHLPVVLQ